MVYVPGHADSTDWMSSLPTRILYGKPWYDDVMRHAQWFCWPTPFYAFCISSDGPQIWRRIYQPS